MCDGTKLLPQVDLITEMHLHSPKAIFAKETSITYISLGITYLHFLQILHRQMSYIENCHGLDK